MTETSERNAVEPATHGFRPWTERLFQVAAGTVILALVVFELSYLSSGYETGIAVRIAGASLAVVAAVILAVWAGRRPEAGAKRNGAFTLTCAIICLLASIATFVIGMVLQSVLQDSVVGWAGILTITLGVFGVISLVTGIIKRINA